MSRSDKCLRTFLIGILLVGAGLFAASQPSSKSSPHELVREALEQEVQGDAIGRAERLNAALALEPDLPAARWPAGYVKSGNHWLDYREVAFLESQRPEIKEYRVVRSQFSLTAADQTQLADWCRAHDLPLRERAHLTAALERSPNPNHPELRARLGYQFLNGVWVTEDELAESQELAEQIQQASKRWLPTFRRIADQLNSPRTDVKAHAKQELLTLDDPQILPAMEAALAQKNLETAHVLVWALSQMKSNEAARFLARQAVLSPFVTVREEAALALRSKPPEAYGPMLLESLHTPIQSRMSLFVGRQGVRLSHRLFSESEDFRQLARLDSQTTFRREIVGNTRIRNSFTTIRERQEERVRAENRATQTALIRTQLQAYAQDRAVDLKNDQLKEWNDRVCETLAKATGLKLNSDPRAWWKWWLDYNQLESDGEKPIQYVYLTESRQHVVTSITDREHSCLVAGTLIWTDRGLMPVEKISVGDLVLSKHPVSGELTYKPVLRTTKRAETSTIQATFGKTGFSATGGHTFWVSGTGWTKLRDAKPGAIFHGVEGPVELTHVDPAKPQPVYNLVVADFHTYFVGEAMVLSHDVTFAEPLDRPVPGFVK